MLAVITETWLSISSLCEWSTIVFVFSFANVDSVFDTSEFQFNIIVEVPLEESHVPETLSVVGTSIIAVSY